MKKLISLLAVAARTPAIGVGGTILTGGFSWMSTEFGCVSDPINFIDAEVVKYDGTIVLASQEPDLLWTLRGGGGGVGGKSYFVSCYPDILAQAYKMQL
jgi:hypothetical protein